MRPSASSVAPWTSSGVGDLVAASRGAEVGRQPVEQVAEPPRVLLALEREQVLEVAEGLRGAVAERDRLLDLEVERDSAVLRRRARTRSGRGRGSAGAGRRAAAPPPRRAARRGSPRAPRRSRPGPPRRRRRLPACAAATSSSKAASAAAGLGRGALLRVGGRERGEVAARERRGARAADVEVLLGGGRHRLERGAQPRLVRVEEVGADRRRGRAAASRPFRERLEGERGVGAGPREARRLAELADEEPGARLSTSPAAAAAVARSTASPRMAVQVAARAISSADRVLGRHRLSGGGEAAASRPAPSGPRSSAAASATSFCAFSGSPRTSARCASASVVRTSAAAFHGSGGAAEAGPAESRNDGDRRRRDEQSRHGYCSIVTPSSAAACDTWPAIAVARSCASVPSTSACSGVNRSPDCSRE